MNVILTIRRTRGQLSRWDYVVEDEKGRVPEKYGDRRRG